MCVPEPTLQKNATTPTAFVNHRYIDLGCSQHRVWVSLPYGGVVKRLTTWTSAQDTFALKRSTIVSMKVRTSIKCMSCCTNLVLQMFPPAYLQHVVDLNSGCGLEVIPTCIPRVRERLNSYYQKNGKFDTLFKSSDELVLSKSKSDDFKRQTRNYTLAAVNSSVKCLLQYSNTKKTSHVLVFGVP